MGLYTCRGCPGLGTLTTVAAFSACVKGACRAIAFLRNFSQVSCLQGQKWKMGQDQPEKGTDEVKQNHSKALWEMQPLSGVRAEQSQPNGLDLVMNNTSLLTGRSESPAKKKKTKPRPSLESGAQ